MTGPEHYREAELLLAVVTDAEIFAAQVMANVAAAQVHATLALAAATALRSEHGQPANDWDEWRKTAAVKSR